MTNEQMGTLYIGVTANLRHRVYEHKTGIYADSFTDKYNLHKLVYIERFDNIESAIRREKQLKEWKRNWKMRLIIDQNPNWIDLAKDWY